MINDADAWREFVVYALSIPQPKRFLLSPAVDAFIVAEAASLAIDVRDFRVRVDAHHLRHVLNNHSKWRDKGSRGQINLWEWHLNQLPDILLKPHRVELAPSKGRSTQPSLKFCKEFYDEGTAHANLLPAVNGQHKELRFQTLYSRRPG